MSKGRHGGPGGRCGGVRLARPVTSALFALSALSALSASAQTSFTKRLDAVIDAPPFNRMLWGVALVDSRGRLRYERNAERLFIPASSTKIVVTAVAAALLPPEWTVRTSVYTAGALTNGVVWGDLVLYGRGDPTFSRRCYGVDTAIAGVCDSDPFQKLHELADTLWARGVRTVAGDLVGDGSYFEPETVNPAWETFDVNWWYAAPVSGLAFNDNSVDIMWGPGAVIGAPAKLTVWPDLGDVELENQTQTIPPGGASDIGTRMFREPGTTLVRAEGTVPAGSEDRTDYFAVADPNLFAARAFRQVLAEAGIAVLGATRSTTDSLRYRAVREATPLAEVESRPLKDWIFPILNTSQNLFADLLLKQLGRQFGGAGSWEEGVAVERRFLIDSVHLDSTQFRLRDGSGLASQNLVSPLAFTQLLAFMRGHPRSAAFAEGLPRPGRPGSLSRRFVGTPLEARLAAKTGTTPLASTLTGYIDLGNGQAATFSIQVNHATEGDRVVRAAIDSVLAIMGTAVGVR